jgi:hypothetical protein
MLDHVKYRGTDQLDALEIRLVPSEVQDGEFHLEAAPKGSRSTRANVRLAEDAAALETYLASHGDTSRAALIDELHLDKHRFSAAIEASSKVWKRDGKRGPYTVAPRGGQKTDLAPSSSIPPFKESSILEATGATSGREAGT